MSKQCDGNCAECKCGKDEKLKGFSEDEQSAIISAVKDGLMPGFMFGDLNDNNNDPITPNHYKSYSVETIDMMVAIYGKEKVATYCELNAFKYRMRAGKKNGINQDLEKEAWYLNKVKELTA